MTTQYRIRRYSKNQWQILAKGLEWTYDNASHPIDFVYGSYENALARLFDYLNGKRKIRSLRNENTQQKMQ